MHYENHEGNIYRIKNESVDLAVTDNHRMWISKANCKNTKCIFTQQKFLHNTLIIKNGI